MKNFRISISTPGGKVFDDEITQLNIGISSGRIGVYANHSPMISSIITSTFSIIKEDGSKRNGVITSGIFNVNPEEVTLLTTNFVWEDEVDLGFVNNEIKNMEYSLKGELLPTERESLLDRLKFVEMQKEMNEQKNND